MVKRIYWLLVIALLLSACSLSSTDPGLMQRVETLEAEVSQHEEYISDQATQIGRQEEFIQYLATRGPGLVDGDPLEKPPTLTPYPSWVGSVVIEEGMCCIGGTIGDTIEVSVKFSAQSTSGSVYAMRVIVGGSSAEDIAEVPWVEYEPEKRYPVKLAGNWTSFWVHVQFKDSSGAVSEVYSNEIALEGMPPQPTESP